MAFLNQTIQFCNISLTDQAVSFTSCMLQEAKNISLMSRSLSTAEQTIRVGDELTLVCPFYMVSAKVR